VTSQTQISVIQSQNQQQPIVPIQHLFQHSSQPECSPAQSQNISIIIQKNWVHIIGLHNITAAVGKTPLCKIWKSADAEKVSIYTLTMWYWIFSEFKKIKIYEFYWMLNVQVLNSQYVIFLTLQSVLWMISEGSEVLMSK